MIDYSRALPGHFYAIGIGPGSSDLLTLRAVRLIASATVIIAPQARGSDCSLSLRAIEPYLSEQRVLRHEYPMRRNAAETRQRWEEIAVEVVRLCRDGEAVVMVTLGDPLIFATTSYLLQALAADLNGEQLHLVPGISAFQAGAARFGHPLALQEDRLLLMSATDLDAVAGALESCETLVLYKVGPVLPKLLALLDVRGLTDRARLFSAVEQGKQEFLLANLKELAGEQLPYMTSMIIRTGKKGWEE